MGFKGVSDACTVWRLSAVTFLNYRNYFPWLIIIVNENFQSVWSGVTLSSKRETYLCAVAEDSRANGINSETQKYPIRQCPVTVINLDIFLIQLITTNRS